MARGAINGVAAETDASARNLQVVVLGVKDSNGVVDSSNPLPTIDPPKGNALSKGGSTSTSSSTSLVATNTNRKVIEVSNGGTSGVWLSFGSAAVVGQGTYLPSKATGFWPTTAQVFMILESGGTGGAVGYTEW